MFHLRIEKLCLAAAALLSVAAIAVVLVSPAVEAKLLHFLETGEFERDPDRLQRFLNEDMFSCGECGIR